MTIDDLLKKIKRYDPDADLKLVEQAYNFASEKHKSHKRLSGDPYITHPLSVANVLADIEQDVPTICAGILHDIVEDSEVTLPELSNKFSPEIAHLVEGVTKLGQLVYESREERQAENFRKMFLAMGEDLRVIIIKLADRLHNMQTLSFLPPEKIKETALETKEIFSPLAHRLGMWKLKWELEDLSFKHLEGAKYKEIQLKVSESRESREAYIEGFVEKLKDILTKVNVKAEVKGRPKHLYSIYRKMVDQNLEFDEIYDLTAVRVIVETIKDCYTILGYVHATWKPIPGRFRDYIAVPKSNGYQSLHTTVIGGEGKPVEVQIRTQEMHKISEYGIAAHWVYKETSTDKTFDKKMAWFRQMLETQTELKDAKDFLDSLKIDLFTDEVFVFTPRGQVIQLPLNSTPIDFAYHVHTEVGHRANGARVNGRIVPLDHKLKNGDIIEILTSKTNNPSLDWLSFIKTSGARTKIKSWFKNNAKEKYEKQEIEERVKKTVPALRSRPRKKKIVHGVNVSGLTSVLVRISCCCRPLPGDEIIGLVTKGRGIAIHRKNCSSFIRNKPNPKKLVPVSWELSQDIFYPVEIEIEAFDRVGVLKDILTEVADTKTNVSSAYIRTKRGSTAFLRLVVDVKHIEQLQLVMQAVRDVPDVYDVKRYDIIRS